MKRHKIISILLLLFYSLSAIAELTLDRVDTVVDSEERFDRRIYSYDFAVSHEGVIHAVYMKPNNNIGLNGQLLADVVYMQKKVGEAWPIESQRIVLEISAQAASISTQLLYDDTSNTVHISYVVVRQFIDNNGDAHETGLVYQRINNNIPDQKLNISSGGFNTLMQLDQNGRALFVREYEVFLDSQGNIRNKPFPKALRIQRPLANDIWTDTIDILNLPPEQDYRLANFIYDKKTGRYHISYGNKNAVKLRRLYPTTNPPQTQGVVFPEGAAHQLRYTYSDDLQTWHTSTVDASGDLSENEFWTDLIVHQESVYATAYRYKTDARGIQEGSTAVIGKFLGNQWQLNTLAGKSSGASPTRAGMGAKILIDKAGQFHGLWDNSPDAPIDSESAAGSTMYRFSVDGVNWDTRQAIFPFSVEGRIRATIYQNKLLMMFLGDATNARLVFGEFTLPSSSDNLMEVATDKMFYGQGEPIRLHARIQGNALSDIYFIVTGPYDKTAKGELTPTLASSIYYFGSDFAWHKIADAMNTQAALVNFPLQSINTYFSQVTAQASIPFIKPGRYRLYSVATKANTPLKDFVKTSPLYHYDLHVCEKIQCAEIR